MKAGAVLARKIPGTRWEKAGLQRDAIRSRWTTLGWPGTGMGGVL